MFTKDKRLRVVAVLMMIVTLFHFSLTGCTTLSENSIPYINGFSVHFIDVGNGDSIFIRFGDGKVMLIDSGAPSDNNLKSIKSVLSQYKISTIDYLLLTHPDVDHVGNAKKIVEDYSVKKAYIPDVLDLNAYPTFKQVVDTLSAKSVKTEYSNVYSSISGDEYYLAFLSPIGDNALGDYYLEFNGILNPNDVAVNNLSPVVYLDYKGVRSVFTGDAGFLQEEKIIEYYNSGMYELIHDGRVALEDVDFLKVGHHGSSDCSSVEFINLLKPKYAVISVGGQNSYGHPSTFTLNRLESANPLVKVLRTDVLGDIAFSVDSNNNVKLYTQARNN